MPTRHRAAGLFSLCVLALLSPVSGALTSGPARAEAPANAAPDALAISRLPASVRAAYFEGKGVRRLSLSAMGEIALGLAPAPAPADAVLPHLLGRNGSLLPQSPSGGNVVVHNPNASGFQSETTIARYGSQVVMGFNDARGFAAASVSGWAYSGDGGSTWTDGGQLSTPGGTLVRGDPDVKVWHDSGSGTTWFAYSSLFRTAGGLSSLCVHVSSNGGAVWVGPREVTSATSATEFQDKEFMWFDQDTGRIHISWTSFGATVTMKTTYSDDLGLTWSPAITVAARPEDGQGSIPRSSSQSDSVYIAWMSFASPLGHVSFVRSGDGGDTWTAPADIAPITYSENPYGSDRMNQFPSMAVCPISSRIYIVYGNNALSPTTDFNDIYFIRSDDAGATWSAPVAVNESPGSDRCQFFSWVDVDPTTGRVDVTYYSQSAGSGSSDITEQMHVHSHDGGLTWSEPAPVSDRPFHGEWGNNTSQPNIGDYNQHVSDDGDLNAAFAATKTAAYNTPDPNSYFDLSSGAGGHASVHLGAPVVGDAGCDGDGVPEVEETFTLDLPLENFGGTALTNGSGVLSTGAANVTILTGAASWPTIAAGATESPTTPFELKLESGFACGDPVPLTLVFTCDQGTETLLFDLETGNLVVTGTLVNENFDGVVAPALPAGWSTLQSRGVANPWKTQTSVVASAPNAAFCPDRPDTNLSRLLSPTLVIPAGTDLVEIECDVSYNTEVEATSVRDAYDGGFLMLSIDGAAASTFVTAFATEFEGRYPRQIVRCSGSTCNPWQDQSTWAGDITPDFEHVKIHLPGLAGHTLRLRFDMASDNSIGTPEGFYVDNVVVRTLERTCHSGCEVALCQLLDPDSLVADEGDSTGVVRGLVFDPVATPPAGAAAGLEAELGFGPWGSDPSVDLTGWTFSAATFESDTTSGEVWSGKLLISPAGVHAYAVRFRLNGGPWCYGDLDGSGNGFQSEKMGFAEIRSTVGVEGPAAGARARFFLRAGPSPFDSSAEIEFSLAGAREARLQVFDVSGRLVATLAEGRFDAGPHIVRWSGVRSDGAPAPSGVYFVKLSAGDAILVQRVVRAR